MARIKINDLPKEMKIKKDELRHIMGGKYIGETEKNVSDLQMFLQDAVQMQSEQLQVISNILKTRSDEENAIINNIR